MRTPPRPTAMPAGTAHSKTFRLSGAGEAAPPPRASSPSKDSQLAGAIKALVLAGERDAARERFAELVASQQRRALRIAYHYLRDTHDADEAVQDAFVKVFMHITTYRDHLPFEVWFTRILVNGRLEMRKARSGRQRCALAVQDSAQLAPLDPAAPDPTAEESVVAREGAQEVTARLDRFPYRQRTVVAQRHLAEQSTAVIG